MSGALSYQRFRPILKRPGQMRRLYLLAPRQVRDRPGRLHHPVIAAHREVHLPDCLARRVCIQFLVISREF